MELERATDRNSRVRTKVGIFHRLHMRESKWEKKEDILQVLLWVMVRPPGAEKIQTKKHALSNHLLFSAPDLMLMELL